MVKDSVCIGDIREFFLTFVLWPQAHRTNILTINSICCLALCEPALQSLKSKNAHRLSRMSHHGVFYTDSFFDFLFDCSLAGQGDFRRILQVAALALGNICYKITAYQRTIYARTSENNRTESYGRRFVYFYCYIFAPCEADAAERDEAAALFIYNN